MTEKDPRKPPPGFTGVWTIEDPWGDRRELTYIDGVMNGPFRSILANGVVHRECEMRNGQYHGELIVRDSDGKVLDRSEFVNGTGVYKIFTSDGRLGWEIPMRHGQRHGIVGRLWRGKWVEEEWCDDDRVSTDSPRLT